ncbi:MAG TPA: M23 family metallopeptidase [Thermoanaerobaculia bacterium]|nr:M23 family metallopeptidase [Thermoanaerobaculia bacterium]
MRLRLSTPAALLAVGLLLPGAPAEGKTVHKKRAAHATASAAPARASVSHKAARHAARVMPAEVYGPFLPLEAYDYPRPECPEFDAVIEVREHDTEGEDAPDVDVAEEEGVGVPPAPNPLAMAARKLGSLLRPKSAASTIRPEDVDLTDILTAGVQIPVEGVDVSRLKDSFLNSRGQHRKHLAIDIGAPKGTPVLAASDGEVITLRHEKRGGISLYQKDPSGRYLLYYCHLTRYASGLREGRKVHKGDVIAYVGRTGHVIGGAHLHFSITRLAQDDDNFKAGIAINPYLLFLAAVP